MPQNLLKNGGFEADWNTEQSHRCLVFPAGGTPNLQDIQNIFTPPGWVTWFRHESGVWDQPEVREAAKAIDPRRIHSGDRAWMYFTFFRGHDAGFYQQVQVASGTKLQATAWAHAWSNHEDSSKPDIFPHPDDARWSEGAGYEAPGVRLEGEPGLSDAWRNFTFYVGIDPRGGTDPYADTVVWGRGAHIYNQHAQVPAAEATAQANTVTVFLRSKTLWPYKHNDAYWDDAELVVVGQGEVTPEVRLLHKPASPKVGEAVTIEGRSLAALTNVRLVIRQPSGAQLATGLAVGGRDGDWYTWMYTTSPTSEVGTHTITFSAAGGVGVTSTFECTQAVQPQPEPERGQPRVQYGRTYVLLPPDAGASWALAVVEGSWDRHRYTVGGSADDAGIGDLDVRRVIAVNPEKWPGDLQTFFQEHYSGVDCVVIKAGTPAELAQKLKQM